jgi:hypothetical protein
MNSKRGKGGVVVEFPNGRMALVFQDAVRRPEFSCYDYESGEKIIVEKDTDEYEELLRAFGFEELY